MSQLDIREKQSVGAHCAAQNDVSRRESPVVEPYEALLEHMNIGVCMYDREQRLVVCNKRFADLYGLTMEQVKPGTTIGQVPECRIKNGIFGEGSPDQYMRERTAPVTTGSDKVQELSDGRSIYIKRRPMPCGGWVTIHEDVTEKRRSETRIAHLATHDLLTDLPNRTLLLERFDTALQRVRRGETIALHWLDLDRFKQVNDTYGHQTGDTLLQAVADRLRGATRETDVVARLGGDEFAILQVPTPDAKSAAAMAERVVDRLSQPYLVNGHRLVVGCSIGTVVSSGNGDDIGELMNKADLALYRAKEDGRGTFRFFEPEMDAAARKRRQLEEDLCNAIVREELELYYQPVLSLSSMAVTGFEALLRWNHPTNGRVNPLDFIPLAEETGLIVPIGEWVLRKACFDAMKWPSTVAVSVNLSVAQFKSDGPVDAVRSALVSSGLAPERLELEITESLLMDNVEGTLKALEQLKRLGVRIAMDDFGTGFSSLSYLTRFPFDKLKIDRSFVKDIAEAGKGLAMLKSVIGIGTNLGIRTTAEGIETVEQLDVVLKEGCSEVQGYLFSPPRPNSEASSLLRICAERATAAARRQSRPAA